jgi:hypothetical protein
MSALLTAARSAWPFDDHEPQQMGIEDGIVWAICPGRMGGFNGYALIPAEGHPWSAGVPIVGSYDNGGWEERASERVLTVHGGITYGAAGPWIGFDTLHAFDIWPAEYDPHDLSIPSTTGWDRRWTVEQVVDEAKHLARQLAAVPA